MRTNSSKTSLFLIELIIAILFFSLAAAICVQLFVSSHLISENSVALNKGLLLAQNSAEAFYGSNGDLDQMKALLTSDGVSCKQVSPTELLLESEDYLEVQITISKKETLLQCGIHVINTENHLEKEVYTLTTSLYPKGNSYEQEK